MKTLKQLLEELMVEINLHPEIMAAIKSGDIGSVSQNIDRITEYLAQKGIDPGYRTDVPRPEGSSRGVLLPNNGDTVEINLDGKAVKVPAVLKYAMAGKFDILHMGLLGESRSLGQWQNEAENGTIDKTSGQEINNKYRVLVKDDDGNYTTNEFGVFPPLFYHDDKNHQYSEVGYAPRIESGTKFTELTKTESHPEGLVFNDLIAALQREWHKSRGDYHKPSPKVTARLDAVTSHPLFKTLLEHQIETGTPPMDYSQPANWGVWTHPHTGKEHLVVVDHGYSDEVREAYRNARANDKNDEEGEEWDKRGPPTDDINYGDSWHTRPPTTPNPPVNITH